MVLIYTENYKIILMYLEDIVIEKLRKYLPPDALKKRMIRFN